MIDEFSELEPDLCNRRISAYRQRPGQLMLSRQRGPACPDAGNSFWICKLAGDWYVCTWSPCYYRVPSEISVLDVAEAFVDVGKTAQYCIPDDSVARFGLLETEYEAFQRLWETRRRTRR